MMNARLFIGVVLLRFFCAGFAAAAPPQSHSQGMVFIPNGAYLAFFINAVVKTPKVPKGNESVLRTPVAVRSFWMDRYPVTRAEFLRFVVANPKWRRSRVTPLFADDHYLEDWKSDFLLNKRAGDDSRAPVTQVSWFAAHAYCEAQGKELPIIDQWEYVAGDLGRNKAAASGSALAWYSKPNAKRIASVDSAPVNGFGVHGLIGLVWEWTLDFNSATVGDESREGGASDGNLFCGNGSQGALDSTDYASFMRYSLRNSLKANYTTKNLGFRCVKEIDP